MLRFKQIVMRYNCNYLTYHLHFWKANIMDTEAKNYSIRDLKTGRTVALMGADGSIQDEGDPQAVAKMRALMRRDLVVRESQLGNEAELEGEEYDPFPEENMCYFGVITLRPDDPAFLPAFVRRLPYISNYEAVPHSSE